MTALLISVRSAAEAEVAIAGGADVIDVKEPTRGALGAPDLDTVHDVVRQVQARATVSVALGELNGQPILPPQSLAGVQFAKVGLAGCAGISAWHLRWRRHLESLPQAVDGVAVAYADWKGAAAPEPMQVLELGASIGCRVLLVDTFVKLDGTLLDLLNLNQLRDLIRAAHDRQCRCALAGSLNVAQIARLLPLNPDYVAVRGAACTSGRMSRIDVRCVQRLAALVKNWRKEPVELDPARGVSARSRVRRD